jgi:hypothetical protein
VVCAGLTAGEAGRTHLAKGDLPLPQANKPINNVETKPEPKFVERRETSRPVNITAAAILISVILHLRTI